MYKSCITLAPKGSSPRETDELIDIEVRTDTVRRDDIVSQLYRDTDKAYVLRNHWEIFNIDTEFYNPPWESREELIARLISFDEAKDWVEVERFLFIDISVGNKSAYISKIENYYSGLNPIESQEIDGSVRVTVQPSVD